MDRRFDYDMSSLEVLTHPSSVKSFFSRVLAKQIHINDSYVAFLNKAHSRRIPQNKSKKTNKKKLC